MKKFLSLALALVMTMSLVTISAGATFTDDSDIVYSEAVDVMTALEIVGGYANGSFDPDATLTRGAAAKIICNLMLGPTVAAALGTNTDPFPDVTADHTFAGYIAYCANEGIISGYTDGTFRPSGTITGFAFMKMLLGALGYDSAVEGYTATNWAVNVSADAKIAGLSDGNEDYDGSKALTREEACLYALNTLKADVVKYDNQSNVTIGDITITNSSTAEKIADYGTYKDYIVDNDYMQFGEVYFTGLKLSSTGSDGQDDFGRPTVAWYDGSTKIGQYVDPSDLVATYEGKVTKGDLYSLLGDDSSTVITSKVDGNTGTAGTADNTAICLKNSTTAFNDTNNSSYTEVYNTATDTYVIVTLNTYLVQALADYNSSNEYLRIDRLHNASAISSSTINNDDVNVEEFAEDDYILVTVAGGDIMSAVLAETVSGEVTSYTSSTNVYLDGTKYIYNKTIGSTASDNTGKAATYKVGEEATLVLDQYGNVVYVDSLTATSDAVVYIDEYAKSGSLSSSAVVAAAYFTDGTYAEITVNEIDEVDASTYTVKDEKLENVTSGSNDDSTGWFFYTAKSDGTYDLDDFYTTNSKYTLAEEYSYTTANKVLVANSTTSFADADDASSPASSPAATTLTADSATVFVVVDGDGDVYTYTGITNVPTLTLKSSSTATMSVVGEGTAADYVFIYTATGDLDVEGSSSSTDYMMILKAGTNRVVTADAEYYEYDVWMDGVVDTVYIEASGLTAGVVYKNIKQDGDLITGQTPLTDSDCDYPTSSVGSAASVEVTRSNDTLYFGSTPMIISDSQIVLVTLDLNNDYIVDEVTTAKGVTDILGDEYIISTIYYAISDNSNDVIDTLFIYVASSTMPTIAAPTSVSISGAGTIASADGSLTLTVAATGTTDGTLSYQWYKGTSPDGVAVSGGTSATLTVENADAGDYYCVVTNSQGGYLSDSTTATGVTVTAYSA